MFDCYKSGDRAVIVHINFTKDSNELQDTSECKALVSSAGLRILRLITGSRSSPSPKYYVGEGKAQEVAATVECEGANVVVFNHILSPIQERNLQRLFQCRVIDKTGLVLDIFAKRARTYEGKLQVELARLRHISTRLVRGWSHLERQKGGIGLRGGPGETQLETDHRLLRERMKAILRRLDKVSRQRDQGRRARRRAEVLTISLAGYTNAGKSTLFNQITESSVYTAHQLFATLDPTLRRIDLKEAGTAILVDTVGFIRHLPHDLIAAFKATLQETREADILLHVVDASDEFFRENMNAVDSVLTEIEANDVPTLLVMNKIDRIDGKEPCIDRDHEGKPTRVWVSAAKGMGIKLLLRALTERLLGDMVVHTLCLPPAVQGKIRSLLYQMRAIQREEYDQQGNLTINICMQQRDWFKIRNSIPVDLLDFLVN